MRKGVGDDHDLHAVAAQGGNGQANAIDRKASFRYRIASNCFWRIKRERGAASRFFNIKNPSGRFHMAAHPVTAEAIAHPKRALKVHARTPRQGPERRHPLCFFAHIKGQSAARPSGDRQADAIDADTFAEADFPVRGGDPEPAATRLGGPATQRGGAPVVWRRPPVVWRALSVVFYHFADALNDPGKHYRAGERGSKGAREPHMQTSLAPFNRQASFKCLWVPMIMGAIK